MSPTVSNPPPHWHRRYAEELERYPDLLAALYDGQPIRAIARQARLPDAQAAALELWALGDSLQDIARALGRSKGTAQWLTERALFHVLLWLVRGVLVRS